MTSPEQVPSCKGSFRNYRIDSIGYPESPMRYWMLNLFKKYERETCEPDISIGNIEKKKSISTYFDINS